MKYIIMCGGNYDKFKTPKHLLKVNGEVIIERTIRLLKENGITDIYISSNDERFDKYAERLEHTNSYEFKDGKMYGYWVDAFYPTDEETCYIFGDVYFSEKAIKTIIKTETNDIELFGSMPPFAKTYAKKWIEPFALKVVNTNHLKEAIKTTKEYDEQGKFWRKPIMWELWTIIKGVPLQTKPDEYIYNYIPINDYTTDVDSIDDVLKIENYLKLGGIKMVKAKAIMDFTTKDFEKLENLVRNDASNDEDGSIYLGDTFECDNELAAYFCGGNDYKLDLVEIVEVIPEEEPKIEEPKEEIEEKAKKTTKRKK